MAYEASEITTAVALQYNSQFLRKVNTVNQLQSLLKKGASKNIQFANNTIKSGFTKLLDPNIKEKMEILYEGILDYLIMHQEDLSMSDRVKLLQSLSNYILPKTKPVRDEFTFDKLIERKKETDDEKIFTLHGIICFNIFSHCRSTIFHHH